ncbi:hypothetical protein CK203_014334 [Vitis vinifera]|uniref:Uncharacterized protein n=1 Tax=Vitis vinifera TaxID=29760 RepID=A0A438K4T4_VITVI|nr:hypothetical protein CK203_014334 [Vitis vinifera]
MNDQLKYFNCSSQGRIPLIGCGGISRVDFSFTTPIPISGWLCCLDLRAGAYLGVKFFELPNLGYMESDKMDPEFRYGHGDRML